MRSHLSLRAQPQKVPLYRATQAGFTLSELLLASLLSVMITSAVYQVFVNTSTNYAKQLEHTQAQSNLRFAAERVKAELRDFGRLTVLNTTPNQRDPMYCGDRTYKGLELKDNDTGDGFYERPEALELNQVRPDRLRLLIDASNATPLLVQRASGANLTLAPVQLQTSRASKRLMSPGSEARFRRLFEGALARVTQVQTGRYDVVPVSGVVADNARTVRLDEAPCASLACAAGGCVITPLHWSELAIVADARSPENTRLVRRRLELATGAPIAGSELVLADYAVDFQVWGDYDTRGLDPRAAAPQVTTRAPEVPADAIINDDQGNWVAGGVSEAEVMNRWPHRLRGLSFLLAVRTPRIDPAFKDPIVIAQPTPQERVSFKLRSADREGFTHVTTLTGSVENAHLYRGD